MGWSVVGVDTQALSEYPHGSLWGAGFGHKAAPKSQRRRNAARVTSEMLFNDAQRLAEPYGGGQRAFSPDQSAQKMSRAHALEARS